MDVKQTGPDNDQLYSGFENSHNEKVNFRNYLFLREDDFTREQMFQQAHRFLGNETLHGAGIIRESFKINGKIQDVMPLSPFVASQSTPTGDGNWYLSICPGTAINKLGQEIVVTDTAQTPHENHIFLVNEISGYDTLIAEGHTDAWYISITYEQYLDNDNPDPLSDNVGKSFELDKNGESTGVEVKEIIRDTFKLHVTKENPEKGDNTGNLVLIGHYKQADVAKAEGPFNTAECVYLRSTLDIQNSVQQIDESRGLVKHLDGYVLDDFKDKKKFVGTNAVDLTNDFVTDASSLAGAKGINSFAVGDNVCAPNRGSVAIGRFNAAESEDNILEVGVGIRDLRENALEITYKGKVSAPKQTPLIEDGSDLITKEYFDNNSSGNDYRPNVNGFIDPSRVSVAYDQQNETVTFLKFEQTEYSSDYFAKGQRFTLVEETPYNIASQLREGINHVFLDVNNIIEVKQEWDYSGLAPVLTIYKTPYDGDIGLKTISVTPDYHGSTMDGDTRNFINEHSGMWISWGLAANAYYPTKLDREAGALINDDVYHPIASLNGEDPHSRVKPSLWGMINCKWGEELFKEFYPSGNDSWLTTVSKPGALYQTIDNDNPTNASLSRGIDDYGEGKGGWFLYFVRPDLRTKVDVGTNVVTEPHDDVLIPLTISCNKGRRYNGLNESVREIANHYKSVICDWKALGLIFIEDERMEEYVNISHLELKDLLYGNVTDCIDSLENGDVHDVRPKLNGFINPERVTVVYEAGDKISFKKYSSDNEYSSDYYSYGKRYKLVEEKPLEVTWGAFEVGINHVFLMGDCKLRVTQSWDRGGGYLPILSVYKAYVREGEDYLVAISVTPDYHGTSMDGETRNFINSNNGAWISWGLSANAYSYYTLDREAGQLVNDDVFHSIAVLNGENGNERVRPALWYLDRADWGSELYKEHLPSGDDNWRSKISTNGTLYQHIDEASQENTKLIENSGKGGWFLYYVRPDLRTVVDENGKVTVPHDDVLIPLTLSCDHCQRYSGLNESVRLITNHYKSVICDWKALGLIFIEDAKMKEYVNIAHLDMKDLLHGNVTDCINVADNNNVHKVRPNINGFVDPTKVKISYNEVNELLSFFGTSTAYYVNGRRYEIPKDNPMVNLTGVKLGINHVFLLPNFKFQVFDNWEDVDPGYLPVLTIYKGTDNTPTTPTYGGSVKTISVTPDYHGTTMDSSTRNFINENNGTWISSGVSVSSLDNCLEREEGVLVNDDVFHPIPARNNTTLSDGTVIPKVNPSLLYINDCEWGKEEISQRFAGGSSNWISELCSGGVYYQHLDHKEGFTHNAELRRDSSVKGGWFLYFVRSDIRGEGDNNDVIIPLSLKINSYQYRYEGLDASVRTIANHYKGLICDWKVLGLMFVSSGRICEYHNIAHFELKDLLFGNVTSLCANSHDSGGVYSGTKPTSFKISNLPAAVTSDETWNGTYKQVSEYVYKMDGYEKYVSALPGRSTWIMSNDPNNTWFTEAICYCVDTWPGNTTFKWHYYTKTVPSEQKSFTVDIEALTFPTEPYSAPPTSTDSVSNDTGAYNFVRADNGYFAKDMLRMDWNTINNRAELEVMTPVENNGVVIMAAGSEKLTVDTNGTISAPAAINTNIANNSKALITKEYADANYANPVSSGGNTKLTYGFGRASWGYDDYIGPSAGITQANSNCSHVILENGVIQKLSYFLEGHNQPGYLRLLVNGVEEYVSPKNNTLPTFPASGSNLNGVLSGLNISVNEGDLIRIKMDSSGTNGQVTMLVESV